MALMYLAIMLVAGAALLLAAVVVMNLQQEDHRRTGLLPGIVSSHHRTLAMSVAIPAYDAGNATDAGGRHYQSWSV